ncbi:MAG: hypothetical protein GVY16_07970 [Planctomycetes bacterium]|jgi:hypothetical protein|nr:O-antigen ligase family protein [Phycisphaerae bacterium]NBB95664.1 hypothetical protein [Planctomycetota bacterium]
MSSSADTTRDADTPGRWAEALRWLAMLLIVATAASRAMLDEMPFSTSLIQLPARLASAPAADSSPVIVEASDLARATWPLVILLAGAMWLLAAVQDRRAQIAGPWLLALLAGFTVWAWVCAAGASDRHAAWLTVAGQATLIVAGLLTASLARDRRRFIVLVVALAAVGMTVALKCVYQRVEEIPARIAEFEARPERYLREMGAEPGTPKARSLESRIRDTSVTGFQALANINAAGLLILAAAGVGLCWAKTRIALRTRKRRERKAGEVHPPSLGVVLTGFGAAATVVALLLTKSRGAVVAAVLVTIIAATVWRWRGALAGRWRRVAFATGAVLLLGVSGVVGYGLSRGRLPSKTLSVRWFYWTGGAKLIAAHPLTGVGPGNFAAYYLHVRQPRAEEEVKTPHNAVVHALTQFGLPGGAAWLALVGVMLVLAARPRRPDDDAAGDATPRDGAAMSLRAKVAAGVCIVAAALLSRWGFALALSNVWLAIFDVLLPVAALAVALAAAWWFGGAQQELDAAGIARIRLCLAAGCGAFVLHNMVTYSFWTPGEAMLFWVGAGACIAQGRPRCVRVGRGLAGGGLGLLGAAGVVLAVGLLWPIHTQWRLTRRAAAAIDAGDLQAAASFASDAAHANPRSADAAMLAAKLSPPDGRGQATTAETWAVAATRRDPANSATWRLLGEVRQCMRLAGVGDVAVDAPADALGEAVARDVANARLRIDYAEALLAAEHPRAALAQIDHVERIDAGLHAFDPTSHKRLSPAERTRIRRIRGAAVEHLDSRSP